MNGSFDHKHHRDFTTNSGVDHVEQSSLDGVVFIGLCVTCAGILLMVIKLCYNYTRNFPVRKDTAAYGRSTYQRYVKEMKLVKPFVFLLC
ncbi:unnamed protein product [Cylicocyclus nassatus]|uniref:Uncharacterized protein n=1 Tax=Cylicocyclus nassatus TaxID=53992 RepID=A0AA36DJ95_CYLNA|nr:unnamed protein product [Cylicocyclus nassatus]